MEVSVITLAPDGNESDCLARPHNRLLCSVIATQELTIRGLKFKLCQPCLQTCLIEIEGGAVLSRVILDQWHAAVDSHNATKAKKKA